MKHHHYIVASFCCLPTVFIPIPALCWQFSLAGERGVLSVYWTRSWDFLLNVTGRIERELKIKMTEENNFHTMPSKFLMFCCVIQKSSQIPVVSPNHSRSREHDSACTCKAQSHPDYQVQQDHRYTFLHRVQNRPCARGLRLSGHLLSLLGLGFF